MGCGRVDATNNACGHGSWSERKGFGLIIFKASKEFRLLGQGHFEGQGLEGVLQDGCYEGKTKINEISSFTVTIHPDTATIAQYAINKCLLNAGNGEWRMIAGWNRDLIKGFTDGNHTLQVMSQYKST